MLRDHLIGDLYEAAVQHDGFLEVFQTVVEALGASGFHMFSWDPERNAPHLSAYTSDRHWDSVVALYDQYYGALDPRREVVAKAAIGEFQFCQDYLSEAEVGRSEFYQDFHIPTGFRYLAGARLARPGSDDILLGLLRMNDRPAYSDQERHGISGMAIHLQRAINLWQDACVLNRDAAIGSELMAQLGVAVFALDGDLKLVFANKSAEAVLRATTCLRLNHGKLSATVAAENARLQAAMAHTLRSRQGESVALRPAPGLPPEIFLGISRLSGAATRMTFSHAEILVTVRRRSSVPMVRARQLQQAFGLTAAEAAVGEALIGGKTPDEYATAAGVSVATVRTQLRAIFEKTGSRSQAEAVGAMLYLPTQTA
ncbi:helix-turn-helix transcriptional regulator [Cupriavidus pauculus]|uniref:LuxR family transcriptional regulator n=1 Tax=Cupriavidus pauculus TaxID=82633 RepID=A0A2N5CDJ6_9BURK|nr:helix-turn-helix transcriptional regulator [Cupriavidus pauculus]PLQ00247.1 LuxR family transcriptional regulator [Cupriavidus pauculus]